MDICTSYGQDKKRPVQRIHADQTSKYRKSKTVVSETVPVQFIGNGMLAGQPCLMWYT